MSNRAPKSVAILGAGITGLTAAFRLHQRGHRVRIFEASQRVGGAICTLRDGPWLIEAGPNTLLAGDAVVSSLINELGLQGEQVAANPAARNRYIVRRGQTVAVPLSPPALIRSPLFSMGAKLRVLREMLHRPRTRPADVSVGEFGREHFGPEIVDYVLNPFVTGIYAGNPQHLSTRHAFPKLWAAEQTHGSLLRAQIQAAQRQDPTIARGIISFRGGLQTLPDALARRLPPGSLRFGARVEALLPGNPWTVVWGGGVAGTQQENFDVVIVALPAPGLAQLRIGSNDARPLADLDAIEHPPVSSLFLGFRRDQVAHSLDGFGVLVPEAERRSLLGILFSSTLFPGRASDGHVALTVIVGGTRQPEVARLSAEKILATITPDLRGLLGVKGAPVFQHHTFWPRAIPQYNLGYETPLETMRAVEATNPGVFIGGQARDGIALPACLAAGEKLAERVSP